MKKKHIFTFFSTFLLIFILSSCADLGYAVGLMVGIAISGKNYSEFIKFNEIKSKIFIRAVSLASLSTSSSPDDYIFFSSRRKRNPDNFDIHTCEYSYRRLFSSDEQMGLPYDTDLLFVEEEIYYKKIDANVLYIYVPKTIRTFEAKQKHTKINGIDILIFFINKNDEIIENYKENGLKKINVHNGIEK